MIWCISFVFAFDLEILSKKVGPIKAFEGTQRLERPTIHSEL